MRGRILFEDGSDQMGAERKRASRPGIGEDDAGGSVAGFHHRAEPVEAGRSARRQPQRGAGAAAVAVVAGFLLAWVNLAVGMIGDEADPANLMHAAVLLVAVAGALVARFRADGLARAMAVAAVVQALAALATWWLGWPYEAAPTCFFVALWLLSAGLFRRAAMAPAASGAAPGSATPGQG